MRSASAPATAPRPRWRVMEAARAGAHRRALALGPEHDARRRVRALHRPGAARRAAGGVREGQPVHAEARLTWAAHLGDHRAGAAALPAQPDADRRVDGVSRSCSWSCWATRSAATSSTSGWRSSIRITACRRCGSTSSRSAAAAGARTIDTVDYADQGQAIADLRNGRVNGVLTIPPDFSRRVLAKNAPRVALIEDNTDNFVSVALAGTLGGMRRVRTGSRLPAPRIAESAVARSSSRSTRTCPTCSTCCRAPS